MVSIIIINYNTYHLTTKCIESIYSKTKNCKYEIILVDNASSECDPHLFLKKFPEINLIISSTNTGFAGGNNLGIAVAMGDYILLLNSDTELVNDAISIALQKIQDDSNIGVLTAQLIYPDGRSQAVAGRFPSLKKELFEFLRIYKFESKQKKVERMHGDLWDYSKPVETDWVWGTFFMFNKKILKDFPNNKLHEDFFMYFEDVLWCYHIQRHTSLSINYIPEPIIIHHLSGSSMNVDSIDIYRTKVVPHEYAFLKMTKGIVYTYLYYLIKMFHQITLRKKDNINTAVFYWNFIKKTLNR